jgi:hypothetical protein
MWLRTTVLQPAIAERPDGPLVMEAGLEGGATIVPTRRSQHEPSDGRKTKADREMGGASFRLSPEETLSTRSFRNLAEGAAPQ